MLASWADSPGRLAHDPRFQDNALIFRGSTTNSEGRVGGNGEASD